MRRDWGGLLVERRNGGGIVRGVACQIDAKQLDFVFVFSARSEMALSIVPELIWSGFLF